MGGKRFSAVLLSVVATGVLIVFLGWGLGLFTQVIPSSLAQKLAYPPCEQLPDQSSVLEALASHRDLADRLQSVGPGVTIEVATPCKEQPDKALIQISYATKAEREGVNRILSQEGFGVPAVLVRR
ncbi:MAG: hypothetical protein L6E13_05040 [Firmicutes bacterium]|nr:hypothetical protein [Bacillota bacterium]